MKLGFMINILAQNGMKSLTKISDWAPEDGFEDMEVGPPVPLDEGEFGRTLDKGINIMALVYYRNYLSTDEEEAALHLAELEKQTLFASGTGIEKVVTSTGIDKSAEEGVYDKADAIRKIPVRSFDTFCRVSELIVELAEEKKVKVAFENCLLMGNIAISPVMWEMILKKFDSPYAGPASGPPHLAWQFIDLYRAAEIFSEKIPHVHTKDTVIDREGLPECGILTDFSRWSYQISGRGELGWKRLFGILRQARYDGTISLKHEDTELAYPLGEIKTGMPEARDYVRTIMEWEDRIIRIGIVGLGYTMGISDQHVTVQKLIPGARIAAVYDVRTERGEGSVKRRQSDGVTMCQNCEELLGQVDAVCICTSSVTYVDLTVMALKAGKHVLCEKPPAPREEDCQEALNYAQLSGKVCMIGLCYRYIPAPRYMKQLIQDGALGEVFWERQVMCSDRMINPRVFREWGMQKAFSGTGVIGDSGSHMLNMTEWLPGEQCGGLAKFQCMDSTRTTEREETRTGRRRAVTNDDVASLTEQMGNGVLISYTVARLGGPGHTFELYGSGGSLVYDGSRSLEAGTRGKPSEDGYQGTSTFIPVPKEYYVTAENMPVELFTVNFPHQTEDFLDCTLNGKYSEAGSERGVHIQRLIDIIEQAAESGVAEDARD